MNLLILAPGCTSYKLVEMYSRIGKNVDYLGFRKYKEKYKYMFDQVMRPVNNVSFSLVSKSQYLIKALEIVKGKNIDIIITHDPGSGFFGLLLKKLTKKPCIFQMCQDFIEYLQLLQMSKIKKFFIIGINKLLIKACCKNFHTIVLSNYLKKRAELYGAKNVKVIPIPGIDLRLFHKRRNNIKKRYNVRGPLLLTVGRLSEEKGTRYLLEGLSLLKKEIRNMHLIIAGSGHLKKELENYSRELQIDDDVTFLGYVKHIELPGLFSGADIFILPSLSEGLGYVIGEALATEIPVIASNTGGIPDFILHKKTGLLINPKNPEDIVYSVKLILKNNGLKRRLIKNGKRYVQRFDEELVTKRYSSFLKKNIL